MRKYMYLFCLLLLPVFTPVSSLANTHLSSEQLENQLIKNLVYERYERTLETINMLRSKKKRLGSEVVFYEGKAYFKLGDYAKALDLIKKYLVQTKYQGPSTRKALIILDDIWKYEEAAAAKWEKEHLDAYEKRKKAQLETTYIIGEVKKINAEWGYIKISSSQQLSSDDHIYIKSVDKNIGLKVGREKNNQYTMTPKTADEIKHISIGDLVYFPME